MNNGVTSCIVNGERRKVKIKDLAEKIGATVIGDANFEISRIGSLSGAKEDQISFISEKRYVEEAKKTRAGALIVADEKWAQDKPALLIQDVYQAFVEAAKVLAPKSEERWGIHGTAVIGDQVEINEPVWIGPHVVIETGAKIGAHARIKAHCYIGRNVRIGEETRLHPGVKIMDQCRVGAKCIIHSGTVIGSDGFGFILGKDGHEKIPQIGIVEVGDKVELGANCVIDRASLDATVIGSGTKVDNLVHIAHSVRIGKYCIILAETVIGGSAEIGDRSLISGNVTIGDHCKIGADCKVAGASAVYKDMPTGDAAMGNPAMSFNHAKRAFIRLRDLPKLFKRMKQVENTLKKSRNDTFIE